MLRGIVFLCMFHALVKALKRNLLVKRLIQGRQKLSLVPKKHEQQQQQQHNNKINDDNHAISINKINQSHNENNDDNRKLKQKQELLERNRYYIIYNFNFFLNNNMYIYILYMKVQFWIVKVV